LEDKLQARNTQGGFRLLEPHGDKHLMCPILTLWLCFCDSLSSDWVWVIEKPDIQGLGGGDEDRLEGVLNCVDGPPDRRQRPLGGCFDPATTRSNRRGADRRCLALEPEFGGGICRVSEQSSDPTTSTTFGPGSVRHQARKTDRKRGPANQQATDCETCDHQTTS